MEIGSKAKFFMANGSTLTVPSMRVALLIKSQMEKVNGFSRMVSRSMVYMIKSRKQQLREKNLLLKRVLRKVVLLSQSSHLLGHLTLTSSRQLT